MYKKKLIEVALPLEAINAASAKEKSIRHGHPSTLHLWWARRPLATCRAVLFASLVDDPSSNPDEFPTEEEQEEERKRLFKIIEDLVKWENINDEKIMGKARREIQKSTGGNPPPVLDPFCGGGSIPLEAQRLGLEAHASDLNPVAVLITKAMIEIPPKFANQPPVNPEARKKMQRKIEGQDWPGASGLAEDVRYYGRWMRDEAERRIGHLYPKAKLPDGTEATVIAWIWARTVKCPNPACGAKMPLVRSFALSTKKGNKAWVEPVIDIVAKTVKFGVKTGEGLPPEPPKIGRGAKFCCLACGQMAKDQHIKSEAMEGRMGAQLMAIVAEGKKKRIYLPPAREHGTIAIEAQPSWSPSAELSKNPRSFSPPIYGLNTYGDLFTSRQLVALTTFSDLVKEAMDRAFKDALDAGLTDDDVGINDGGRGARAYAEAVATYLAFPVDRSADYWASTATWYPANQQISHTFTRQAIPMAWDFVEANPFSNSSGSWHSLWSTTLDGFHGLPQSTSGSTKQHDASEKLDGINTSLISTDPPYYDNISYADLSDFFYVWLRSSLVNIYPDIFSTMLAPKDKELVATPHRFNGNKDEANHFFEMGLGSAFKNIRDVQSSRYPTTIYYAYKQAEKNSGTSSGWESMLDSLIKSGHSITGTWPMRSEQHHRMIAHNTNALASSIVLVCRPRPEDAPLTTRRDLIASLKRELPEALRKLQQGSIAPVDLAQSAIGPGMAIFSRYAKVVEPDGSAMSIRTALQLINQHLDEFLAEQENEYDPDTRWALAWFEQYGMKEGPFGDAETLSKAKNTSVEGMVQSGILRAGGGKVRLLKRDELDPDWNPSTDKRMNIWEMTQHLIQVLDEGGEVPASELMERLGGVAESGRDLAYRLYSICERKGWTQEAVAYNSLVAVWPRLRDLRAERRKEGREKGEQQPLDVL